MEPNRGELDRFASSSKQMDVFSSIGCVGWAIVRLVVPNLS
jgi:hypothetical protein